MYVCIHQHVCMYPLAYTAGAGMSKGLTNGDADAGSSSSNHREPGSEPSTDQGWQEIPRTGKQQSAAQPCLLQAASAKPGSQLLLAASFDLNALAPLGPDLAACPSSALPPNAVILELAGAGFFAIPMGTPLTSEPLAGAKVIATPLPRPARASSGHTWKWEAESGTETPRMALACMNVYAHCAFDSAHLSSPPR